MRRRIHLANDLPDPDLGPWLHRASLRADAVPPGQILHGGRNEVFWIERAGQRIAVKRFLNRGLWKKLAYRIATSKARRSFEHSQRLIDVGLLSPRPLAWREDWGPLWLRESLYLCEYVEFAHDVAQLQDRATPDWELKTALAGQTIGRLHQLGLRHLDLNFGNLLFARAANGSWQAYLIDTNRMSFGPVSSALGMKLLLRLELEGEALEAVLDAYARQRKLDPGLCRRQYYRARKTYHIDRKIRDATRPWRKRIGL